MAKMDVHGGVLRGGDAEDLDNFVVSGGGGVVDAHADGESAALQSFAYAGIDFGEFLRSGFAMSGVTGGQKISGVVHYLHADGNVADADAEVDEGFIFAGGVPGVDVAGADFQFERSGDAIVGLKLIVARRLAVFVEIDEAGSDDQTFGVERGFAFQRLGGERANFSGR